MSTKLLLAILAVQCLAFPSTGKAQRPPASETLETMLDDARYVFNRYDELATGVLCDSWRAPSELRKACNENLRLIGRNVQSTKVTLRRASSEKPPKLADLFSVSEELHEVSSHLNDLSSEFGDFTDQDPRPYAQAAAKAAVLAANLAKEIYSRLKAQEARCAVK
jgi:hypothetical protein